MDSQNYFLDNIEAFDRKTLRLLQYMKKIVTFIICAVMLFAAQTVSAQQLSIIVNKENPTEVFSDKDLINYFLKSKRVWSHGLKVNPVDFLQSTAEKQVFLDVVMHMSAQDWQAHWERLKEAQFILAPIKIVNASQVIDLVAFDKATIGYVFSKDLTPQALQRVRVVRTIN